MKIAVAALGLLLSLQAALAAEPVYPPASRVGLVPLEDMVPSRRFTGFENPQKAAAITITELPSQAYEQLVAGMTKESLRRQGLDVTSRETLKIDGRSGLLISGAMTGPVKGRKWVLALKGADLTALLVAQVEGGNDGYSEAEVRAALKSVALRGPVSLEEQIGALPFRIRDPAGFRPVRVIAGNSVLFTDGPKDTIKAVEQPILILAASQAPMALPADRRDQFAQAALNSNEILKEVAIERSESFRLQGQDWHEIVAKAKEAASGEPVVVMQTIRFDNGRYVRMVGMARVADRQAFLPRFRKVIDGVETAF
ncbi:hypothetical protein [Microvirga sp. 17 mud 1-3]|uniref:hypothetical protein n=1 Tax=Microvirga sp. 17 mud 1-3 TaxID=2082949 RepID=UPI000D6D2F04|nr:hypothetical protein [Microvirga sp. 17 mud 1-3]AWM85973.1 hypothetical protein C4E04_03915 [Microvirga sp. 17 mud 1-3]